MSGSVMLLARYEVADVDRFVTAFDGFDEARRRAGATSASLVRSSERPGTVVAMIEFATRDEARAFAGGEERLRTLEQAGVTSRTDELFDVIRL